MRILGLKWILSVPLVRARTFWFKTRVLPLCQISYSFLVIRPWQRPPIAVLSPSWLLLWARMSSFCCIERYYLWGRLGLFCAESVSVCISDSVVGSVRCRICLCRFDCWFYKCCSSWYNSMPNFVIQIRMHMVMALTCTHLLCAHRGAFW